MKLTTKGRYAVTAMLDVAIKDQQSPVSLADISERQGISLSYLEQLFSKLRKAGLVKSVRGPGGGYLLGREAKDINVAEVILSVNEVLDATRCNGQSNCKDGRACLTHNLWQELSDQIHSFLSGISLASVLQSNLSEIEQNNTVQPLEQIECHTHIEQNSIASSM